MLVWGQKFDNYQVAHPAPTQFDVLRSAFSSIFLSNYQMHGYFTRTSKQFHIPKIRTNIKKFSICYQRPKIFTCNSLPTDIQFSNTLSSFSCKLYKFLFSLTIMLCIFFNFIFVVLLPSFFFFLCCFVTCAYILFVNKKTHNFPIIIFQISFINL